MIFCQQKRIMTGIAGTTLFGVGQGLTRAELAVMMWRYAEPEAANAYRNDAANTTGWATLCPKRGTPLPRTGRLPTR